MRRHIQRDRGNINGAENVYTFDRNNSCTPDQWWPGAIIPAIFCSYFITLHSVQFLSKKKIPTELILENTKTSVLPRSQRRTRFVRFFSFISPFLGLKKLESIVKYIAAVELNSFQASCMPPLLLFFKFYFPSYSWLTAVSALNTQHVLDRLNALARTVPESKPKSTIQSANATAFLTVPWCWCSRYARPLGGSSDFSRRLSIQYWPYFLDSLS